MMRYRDQRYPAETAVRVTHDDEVHVAELVNVSATGARILHLEPLPLGCMVTISYLHARIQGRVVRSNDSETSVRFVMPLSTADLSALRGSKGSHAGHWGMSGHHSFRELS